MSLLHASARQSTESRTQLTPELTPEIRLSEGRGYRAAWGRLLGWVWYMCTDFRLCPVFIIGKSLDFLEKFQKSFIAALSQNGRQ
ncbi:MAG: hypothetical protein A3H27_17615 [Acidobacteria bacterium RIFCSPLOWO2_02_FULL_59_13]|nr:MAG: hypothetical protein A3H27_17615 [Acidobacteria bacterium RIFCSPLOWO2_02_FULL_59_13]